MKPPSPITGIATGLFLALVAGLARPADPAPAPVHARVHGAARAQDDDAPACRKCRSLGWQPCKAAPRDLYAWDCGLLYCSDWEACEGGLPWLDCPDCENLAVEAELARRRVVMESRREPMREYDQQMGRELRKGESEHFVLVWDIESLKVGKRRLKAPALLVLYLQRLEEVFALYCEALGAQAADFQRKPEVFVWWLPGDQREASLRFCQNGSDNGVKLLGSTPRYSVCGNKQRFKDDESLHRNVVHNVSHLLLSHQTPSRWIGNIKGGWADAGLAHWFEERLFGRCTNYCYQEQDTNVDFKGGKYRPAVRKIVAMGKEPPIASVITQNTDTLTPVQHAIAFSYVDFLLARDGSRFNLLAKRLRTKVPTRDALKAAFDLNPLQMEEEWRAWVLETYPAR